eukprot:717834-Amphidinium_carterae.1
MVCLPLKTMCEQMIGWCWVPSHTPTEELAGLLAKRSLCFIHLGRAIGEVVAQRHEDQDDISCIVQKPVGALLLLLVASSQGLDENAKTLVTYVTSGKRFYQAGACSSC